MIEEGNAHGLRIGSKKCVEKIKETLISPRLPHTPITQSISL